MAFPCKTREQYTINWIALAVSSCKTRERYTIHQVALAVSSNLTNKRYTVQYNTILDSTQPKNVTDLLRVVNFTGLLQLVLFQQVATSLSISSSCDKSVEIRLVKTCHLQTFYNLLKQLATSLLITSFDNQLATSLLTTCNRLVVNKLSQAMRTHPGIGLL